MDSRNNRPSFTKLLIVLVTAGLLAASCSTKTGNERSTGTSDENVRVERVRLAGSNIIGYPNPFGPSRGTTVAYGSLLFDTLLW